MYLELNQLITCRIIFPHAIIIMLPIWQPSIYSFKCILTHRVLYCSKSSIIHCRDLHLITVNGRRTVTSHNNHIWKWIVSLYPYMVNSWHHKPPAAFHVPILVYLSIYVQFIINANIFNHTYDCSAYQNNLVSTNLLELLLFWV